MAEKMRYARRELDGLRGLLMHEPRGRQDMYGALLTAPCDPGADYGLVFMNTQQYTTMCGHATIGAATMVIETGMVQPEEPETVVVFDTPVGPVETIGEVRDGQVVRVSFRNAPVFVYELGVILSLPDIGQLPVDVVYSGGFFVLVEARLVGLDLVPEHAGLLGDMGARLCQAANEQLSVRHPDLAYVNTIDAVEFHEPEELWQDGTLFARNVTTFGERTVDRSPCGTGTCARMATLHAKGKLAIGQEFVSESIIGTRFHGTIEGATRVGGFDAIVPSVRGRAYITGYHQFVLDPADPFPRGFSLQSTTNTGGSPR
jgi:proline racemase/trans-L-3-hydroxyproline dehydratase